MKISNRFKSFRMAVLLAVCSAGFSLSGADGRAGAARNPPNDVSAATGGQEVTPAGDELTWPREFQDNGTKVDIYQPQIEKWEGADFETRSAVAITAVGSNAPVY